MERSCHAWLSPEDYKKAVLCILGQKSTRGQRVNIFGSVGQTVSIMVPLLPLCC